MSTKSRDEWISDLKNGRAKLQDCPSKYQEDYEVVHAACSSKDANTRIGALQMVGGINALWQMDPWLRFAAGVGEEPDIAKWGLIVSKKFAMKRESNSFSLHVIRCVREHDLFKGLMIYIPDFFNKSFCLFIEGGAKDGEVDWDRCTDRSYPCRGGSTCKHPVLSTTGRPTLGSCWRFSFKWHIVQVHANKGFYLQIVDLVEGQLQLGDGQAIEEEMAYAADIPILRIEEKAGKDVKEIVEETAQRYRGYKSGQSKVWDDGFARKTAREAEDSNISKGDIVVLVQPMRKSCKDLPAGTECEVIEAAPDEISVTIVGLLSSVGTVRVKLNEVALKSKASPAEQMLSQQLGQLHIQTPTWPPQTKKDVVPDPVPPKPVVPVPVPPPKPKDELKELLSRLDGHPFFSHHAAIVKNAVAAKVKVYLTRENCSCGNIMWDLSYERKWSTPYIARSGPTCAKCLNEYNRRTGNTGKQPAPKKKPTVQPKPKAKRKN